MNHLKTVLTAESCYKLILTLLLHSKKKSSSVASNNKQDYILVYLDDVVILSKKNPKSGHRQSSQFINFDVPKNTEITELCIIVFVTLEDHKFYQKTEDRLQ